MIFEVGPKSDLCLRDRKRHGTALTANCNSLYCNFHAVKTNIEKHCWQNLKQQEKWNLVVNSCHDATSTTVSKIDPKRKSNDPRVIQLSKEQKEIHAKINSNISEDKRKELKKQRNNMQHEIRKILTEEKHRDIIESIEDIERLKDESAKMFKAVRVVKRAKPKKQLLIESENGVTSNDKDQVKIIGNFFEKFFDDENYQQIENIEPTEMKIPFTPKEIENATNKLKNGKSPGCDELRAEQLKHGPKVVYEIISDILNVAAKTGEYPTELKNGLLTPLQKPGKNVAHAQIYVQLYFCQFSEKYWQFAC